MVSHLAKTCQQLESEGGYSLFPCAPSSQKVTTTTIPNLITFWLLHIKSHQAFYGFLGNFRPHLRWDLVNSPVMGGPFPEEGVCVQDAQGQADVQRCKPKVGEHHSQPKEPKEPKNPTKITVLQRCKLEPMTIDDQTRSSRRWSTTIVVTWHSWCAATGPIICCWKTRSCWRWLWG